MRNGSRRDRRLGPVRTDLFRWARWPLSTPWPRAPTTRSRHGCATPTSSAAPPPDRLSSSGGQYWAPIGGNITCRLTQSGGLLRQALKMSALCRGLKGRFPREAARAPLTLLRHMVRPFRGDHCSNSGCRANGTTGTTRSRSVRERMRSPPTPNRGRMIESHERCRSISNGATAYQAPSLKEVCHAWRQGRHSSPQQPPIDFPPSPQRSAQLAMREEHGVSGQLSF